MLPVTGQISSTCHACRFILRITIGKHNPLDNQQAFLYNPSALVASALGHNSGERMDFDATRPIYLQIIYKQPNNRRTETRTRSYRNVILLNATIIT